MVPLSQPFFRLEKNPGGTNNSKPASKLAAQKKRAVKYRPSRNLLYINAYWPSCALAISAIFLFHYLIQVSLKFRSINIGVMILFPETT